jgi:CarboxypepD_reg-like domain
MNQKLSITIGKPCSEKFNQFKTTKSGGFCNLCKKEVIDFRNMSDEKLIEYFKTTEGNTCGYFKTPQLKEYAHSHELNKTAKFKYLKVVGLAFLSAISLHNIQAQEQSNQTEIIENTKQTKSSDIKKDSALQTPVTGIVSDESGPLIGVNIVIKNSNIGVASNFDGEFEFPQALKEGDVLVFSYLGYVTKEVQIKNNQSPINIKMDEDMIFIMGEVDVNEVYKSKRTLFQKIKDIF